MKLKAIGLVFASMLGIASATVTLQTQFGIATDVNGVALPDGTLWALVVDTNVDSTFAGGFGLNSSLTEVGAQAAFTIGQSITLGGNFGSDTIFAMGGFNGFTNNATLGLTADVLELTLGQNGLAAGRNFAFYYFPGVTYTGNSAILGSQIGGIHSGADANAGLDAMIIPADGATVSPGAATSELGGSVSAAGFQAVNLIPEPSAALLGAIGALGLLRRRRI